MMNEIPFPFHTDPVVTDQLFGHLSRPGPAGPEKELLVAVLADALDCYCRYSKSRKNCEIRLFQEAEEWIFAENEDSLLSFVNVCDALTLNPNYLRQKLLDHEANGATRVTKPASKNARGTKSNSRARNSRGTKRKVLRRRISQST